MEDWEHRRTDEDTSEYLGRVLDEYLELPLLAKRAREGYYNEYLSPDPDGQELLELIRELKDASDKLRRIVVMYNRMYKVMNAAKQGEFDTSKAEADCRATPQLRTLLFGTK
jgi:hypothetical protein